MKAPPPVEAADEPVDPLLAFYSGNGRDSEGRTLEEILGWTDERLEYCHDYIQWLFPTDQPSAFNSDAPLVTSAGRATFKKSQRLRDNLLRAFDRMLAFYGFQSTSDPTNLQITPSAD
jgi:hypothetical protein